MLCSSCLLRCLPADQSATCGGSCHVQLIACNWERTARHLIASCLHLSLWYAEPPADRSLLIQREPSWRGYIGTVTRPADLELVTGAPAYEELEQPESFVYFNSAFVLTPDGTITDRYEKHEIHINAVNLSETIKPQHGDSVRETIRNNLRAVEVDAKVFGKPVLAHINHPNFHYSLTAEDLAHVLEARFFEVYNGHPGINHLGNDENPGDEELWDIANTIRVGELEAPPLFGLATDDSHTYHGGDVSPGRGWVMVRAAKLDADELVGALKRGDFYASSGVVLKEVSWHAGSRTHALEIEPVDGVSFETRFIGTRRATPDKPGEVLATVEGRKASYTVKPGDLYVRAVVTSSRAHPNPSFKGQREQAWTQPVGW